MAVKTWTNGAADEDWATAGNWSPANEPVDGDSLVFTDVAAPTTGPTPATLEIVGIDTRLMTADVDNIGTTVTGKLRLRANATLYMGNAAATNEHNWKGSMAGAAGGVTAYITDYSTNSGTIKGTVWFTVSAENLGTVTGDAYFDATSKQGIGGSVSGTAYMSSENANQAGTFANLVLLGNNTTYATAGITVTSNIYIGNRTAAFDGMGTATTSIWSGLPSGIIPID